MGKNLIFAFLLLTFVDSISQSRDYELNYANQNALSIKIEQERIDIEKEYLEVYKDSSNSLTYEAIRTTNPDKFVSYSKYTDGFNMNTNYWLKFHIKNSSDKGGDWALEFRDIPFIEIYIVDNKGGIEILSTGTHVPASEKQMNSTIRETIIFTLQPKQTKTFYVKFQYLFFIQDVSPISVSDTKSYIRQTTIDNLVQGIFQGLLWLMLFYNLFLFISTREKSYLYYIGYVFSFAILMLYAYQYLQDFIFPENPGVGSYFGIAVFVAFIFYFLLLREFIDSRKKHPRIDKSLKIIIIIDSIVTAIVFIIQFIYLESFALAGMQYVFLNALILLVYVVIIFKIENRTSKIFAIGTLFLGLFISLAIIGTYMGADPDKLTLLFQLGIVGQVFIFSAGLSYKYKLSEQQKQKAQEGIIIQLKENQQLQTKVNRELEQEVGKRTVEISQQKEELSSTLEYLKQTQNQLVQTEKMAGIGQLTAGIAHEINNPINYITSSSSALKNDIRDYNKILDLYAEINIGNVEEKLLEIAQMKEDLEFIETPAETEELLINIKAGGEKVAEIVKSLRTFSRLDESDLKTVNLHENIDATITILNNRIATHIEIEKHYGDILEVECFPGELNQVFLNILNNAIDATGAGGKIIVQTEKNPETCTIRISDTGKGIPKDIQDRIFEPFFTTKDIGKGKGLGLSTAHNIIKEHHGTIEVESQIDKGTTFTIVIPVLHSNSKNN